MDNILSPGGIQCEALCTLCTRTVIYLREYSAGHCALSGDIQCAALYALCVHTVRCVVTYSTKYCAHCVYTLCYLTPCQLISLPHTALTVNALAHSAHGH